MAPRWQVPASIEPATTPQHRIGLRACAAPGYRYSKAGIVLADLVPAARQPAQLFATRDPVQSAGAIAELDAINGRFGPGTLRPLSSWITRPWQTQALWVSTQYAMWAGETLVAMVF